MDRDNVIEPTGLFSYGGPFRISVSLHDDLCESLCYVAFTQNVLLLVRMMVHWIPTHASVHVVRGGLVMTAQVGH